jgi:2-C-methyl-D-erythritol 4-phosphate cytidylyltransferase
MKCWAVIPAAGVGQRMGADMPKQYLPLAGRTVIDWSISKLLEHPSVHGVMVALGRDDPYWQHTEYANHPSVERLDGGAERCHSVLNALNALSKKAPPGDWTLVHDAARPCVSTEDISKLIDMVKEKQLVGGLLGMQVRDTMKRTDHLNQVTTTVERDRLWHAFTPQMFMLGELRTALSRALAAGVQITDEASAMEWAGHLPTMVEGRDDNIKITRPADLSLAEFYLQSET